MMKSVNFIMGILPGWWLGESDNRSLEPFVSPSRWDKELRAAGFSGTETVVYDNDEPRQINSNIISRPSANNLPNGNKKVISMLATSKATPQYEELKQTLLRYGYEVEYYTIDQKLPVNQDIISVLELSEPFFDDISSEAFVQFQEFVSGLGNNRLLWLTVSSQITCSEPRFSLILGLARTLRAETSVDFTTLELDALGSQAWESIVAVFEKIQNRDAGSTGSDIDPDYEYALSNGVVNVGRYHAMKVPHELPAPIGNAAPKKLKIGKLGLLQSLTWEQQAALPELGEDELEVEPRCVGLNFRVELGIIIHENNADCGKDVLSSMGIIEASKGGFGLEASAIVRKVGSRVKNFAVGDRIMVFRSGCFSTKMHVSAMLCAKIPDEISDEDAATIPTVYSTVVHSLMNLGNLRRGQVSASLFKKAMSLTFRLF
jgi:hypothetical protein